jgi:ATP-dependent DNA helicase RecQ
MCNYFSIAIGSGENETYALDIRSFTQRYDFDALMTFNSLKILELNKTILLNEAVFHPTRVKIAVENKTLYSFQLKHDRYDPLLTLLCRSYPGIFSNYFELHEKQILTRLKITKSNLKEQLTFLEKQGVIDIVWQSDLPQVTLLHERLPDNYLRIDKVIYDTRKEVAEKKLKAMNDFIRIPQCRSVALLSYFGQVGKPCGKCDQCVAAAKSDYTTDELMEHITTLLKETKLTGDEIAEKLAIKDENHLTNTLSWMLDEGMVSFEDGGYFLRG